MSDVERFILITLALFGWFFAISMWVKACKYYAVIEHLLEERKGRHE